MELYRIYDKKADENDLAICTKFTEQGAHAEVERQRQKGRDAVFCTFTPHLTTLPLTISAPFSWIVEKLWREQISMAVSGRPITPQFLRRKPMKS